MQVEPLQYASSCSATCNNNANNLPLLERKINMEIVEEVEQEMCRDAYSSKIKIVTDGQDVSFTLFQKPKLFLRLRFVTFESHHCRIEVT